MKHDQQQAEIIFEDGYFWLIECDELGIYHRKIESWNLINMIANGERWNWSLQCKSKSQRKWRTLSVSAVTIQALIDHIKAALERGDSVRAMTPDLLLNFYK